MADRIRVGVIGGGMIAKAHVIALRAQRSYFGRDGVDADVVVLADSDPAAAEDAARAYSIGRWATDWHAVVEDDGIDAVTIATPNDLHAEIAVAAAAAGKHTLCEKPLAHSIDAARRMTAAAEAAGVVNSVNLNYRSIPAVQYARRLVEEGELGDIVGFRAAFLQDWGADPQVARSWKFDARRSGGGPMLSVGCHVVDLAHYLVGEVSDVVAATRTCIPERPLPQGRDTYAPTLSGSGERAAVDVEDLGSMLLRFQCGAIGTLETSRIAPGRKNYCFIELNGTHGSLVFDYERMNEILVSTSRTGRLGFTRVVVGPEQDGGLLWTLGGLGVGFGETITLHMRGFVTAILAGGAARPSFRDGLRAQEVVEAATRSTRTGTWEPVAYGKPASGRVGDV